MSKNTNLSFLTDFLTADIVNSRVGMNNVSPQSTFDVTGTGKFSGVLTLGSTVSNGTYTYTLPSATGTLALTSDIPSVSGYVPYTGATGNVDLGTRILSANNLIANGGFNSGALLLKNSNAASLIDTGYFKFSPSSSNTEISFGFSTGASTWKQFSFSSHLITDNTVTMFSLPNGGGTLAVVGGSGVGTVTSVAAITLGTSGTDLTSTVANGTTTPVITLNVPDASVTARGVITTGTQYIAGLKIFTSTIVANVDLQLPAAGTASTTFIKNINGTGLASFGSNGFGFNNADNIYFSGSNKGGGVFAFSNTGTQIYTLQNASGTLAFTSQIPTNAVGGTGTLNTIPKFTAATTIGNSNIFDSGSIIYNTNPAAGTFAWQFNGSTVTGQSYGAQVIAGTNASDIGFKVMNAAASINYLVVRGDGLVTLTGALSGTSATFTSSSSNQLTLNGGTTIANRLLVARGTDDASQNLLLGWNAITVQRTSVPLSSPQTDFSIIQQGSDASRTVFNIASTGAATFSSSVTATGLIINNNGEALRAYGVSPNVSFYNSANTVRGGYVNHDGSNMNIVANVGGLSFTGAATFSNSVTAKGTGNYNGFIADNSSSATIGGGYYSAHSFGVQRGIFGVAGAISGTTDNNIGIFAEGGLGIKFFVNGSGTASHIMTSGGNVLIGTTTDNGNKLQVNGTARFGNNLSILGNESLLAGNSNWYRKTFEINVTTWSDVASFAPQSSPQYTYGYINITAGAYVNGGAGNGVVTSRWYYSISNNVINVGVVGSDIISGSSPSVRLIVSSNTIIVQVQSYNTGNISFTTVFVEAMLTSGYINGTYWVTS
jgi:hypothetical protein